MGAPIRLAIIAGVGLIAMGLGIFAAARGRTADSVVSAALAEKQAIVDREEALIAAGNASPASVPVGSAPAPESPPVWQEGIVGPAETDFPSNSGYDFINSWKQVIAAQDVVVYAGSRTNGDDTGVVLVMTFDPNDLSLVRSQAFDTPIPGPVQIESADGNHLTLVSNADGSRTVFDASEGRFLLQ